MTEAWPDPESPRCGPSWKTKEEERCGGRRCRLVVRNGAEREQEEGLREKRRKLHANAPRRPNLWDITSPDAETHGWPVPPAACREKPTRRGGDPKGECRVASRRQWMKAEAAEHHVAEAAARRPGEQDREPEHTGHNGGLVRALLEARGGAAAANFTGCSLEMQLPAQNRTTSKKSTMKNCIQTRP